MAEFRQPGERIDVTADKKIEYHELITVGTIVAVATHSADVGESISCNTTGVYELDKADSEAIKQGTVVYLNADGKITATAEGGTKAGIAWEDAAEPAATVEVKINA